MGFFLEGEASAPWMSLWSGLVRSGGPVLVGPVPVSLVLVGLVPVRWESHDINDPPSARRPQTFEFSDLLRFSVFSGSGRVWEIPGPGYRFFIKSRFLKHLFFI